MPIFTKYLAFSLCRWARCLPVFFFLSCFVGVVSVARFPVLIFFSWEASDERQYDMAYLSSGCPRTIGLLWDHCVRPLPPALAFGKVCVDFALFSRGSRV